MKKPWFTKTFYHFLFAFLALLGIGFAVMVYASQGGI